MFHFEEPFPTLSSHYSVGLTSPHLRPAIGMFHSLGTVTDAWLDKRTRLDQIIVSLRNLAKYLGNRCLSTEVAKSVRYQTVGLFHIVWKKAAKKEANRGNRA